MTTSNPTSSTERAGKVVQTMLDGLPVLWTLVPELPDEQERRELPWLTVVSWPYDGSSRNGMPDSATNADMLELENALGRIERPGGCYEAYRRIGRDLREFVFQISDRDQFLSELNQQLAGHPQYPIKIKFFEDPLWLDVQELIDDLGLS